jgi:hypothetical protein
MYWDHDPACERPQKHLPTVSCFLFICGLCSYDHKIFLLHARLRNYVKCHCVLDVDDLQHVGAKMLTMRLVILVRSGVVSTREMVWHLGCGDVLHAQLFSPKGRLGDTSLRDR